jgi:hypothetical protein
MSGKSKVNRVASPQVEIVDAIDDPKYEQLLYRCLIRRKAKWIPVKNRENYEENLRYRYLKDVVPKGFHFKVLFHDGDYVAMVEYAPAEFSGYPITGDGVVVMNCVWVLRKYGGNDYGRVLVRDMMDSEREASGFATIGLENQWTGWLTKKQMEVLGFESVRSIELAHKMKHRGRRFTLHLMWLPAKGEAEPPTWDESKLLEGYYVCDSHPLYHHRYGNKDLREIYER